MQFQRKAIWWVRRDLRLTDNSALQAAVEAADLVVPAFILDPFLLESSSSSEMRNAFLFEGLRKLDQDLRRLGSYLVIRRGDPVDELCALAAEVNTEAVFAELDHSPYARRRDRRAAEALQIFWCGGPAVHPPDLVRKPDGKPYKVFTPFSKAWRALSQNGAIEASWQPTAINTPAGIPSAPLPERIQTHPMFPSGEASAWSRLERFISAGIESYHLLRNRVDLEGTSALSPYLHFGMLPARRAAEAAVRTAELQGGLKPHSGPDTWLGELIWRDFYIGILYHFPQVRQGNFRPRRVKWRNHPVEFAAWKTGETGFPIVDAAMRQLTESGWINNRARMIVASFLTKNLLIDWRWGERWFMQHLIDGDPAANNGGWQWVAGTGTDAAPYFRILNPILQSRKADPGGEYIRRWIPEISSLPDELIHTPWMASAEDQRRAGFRIGRDYPQPIVDHTQTKMRVLEAYQ